MMDTSLSNDQLTIEAAFRNIETIKAFLPSEKTQSQTTSPISPNASNKDAIATCQQVRHYLPLATAYKIKQTILKDVQATELKSKLQSIFDDDTEKKSNDNDMDHDCHGHFTLFSLWSAEFGSLIRASFLTLRLWFTGKLTDYKRQKQQDKGPTAPLWFAFASLLIFPLVLVPLLYLSHRLLAQIGDLAKSWWHTVRNHKNQPQLKKWITVLIPVLLFLPIILLPIFCTPNFLYTEKIDDKETEKFPVARSIARFLIFFASLGTGFIAVTAIMASPLGASIGAVVWLFFIAGFLSEWQTLELSLYDLLKQLFKNKDPGLKEETRGKIALKLNREWGVPKNKHLDFEQWAKLYPTLERQAWRMHQMQRAAFAFSLVIGVGIFALAFSHSQAALMTLFGSALFASSPVGLTFLLFMIASATAIAYFCLVYRGLREAIYNPYGDHLIGAWIKALHKLFKNNTMKGKPWWHIIKPIAMTMLALGMTFLAIFYIMTAGPAWSQAAVNVYKSQAFAMLLEFIYYPIMFVFYSAVSKKAADAIVTLGVQLWKDLRKISKSSFSNYREAMKGRSWPTQFLLGVLGVVETTLKTVCFIVLDFGLTLGLFLLHLLGDAAIGSEECAPIGFSEHSVLALNTLSHFFADFSFILEWAHGDLNHDDHHHQDENPVLPYTVSIPYALACLTVIIPICHFFGHKIFPDHIQRSPINCLITNKMEVDNDISMESNINKQLNSESSNPENEAGTHKHHTHDHDDDHYLPCHWLKFVRGEKNLLTLMPQPSTETQAHSYT